MAIQFPVAPGTILLCDYDTGFRPPEMVKRRLVVVVSPRLPHRDMLCTVVPLSTTQPKYDLRYVHRIRLSGPLSPKFTELDVWAKADMLATVGYGRLDLFRTGRDATGRRRFLHPRISPEDLTRIRFCIAEALGFANLLKAI